MTALQLFCLRILKRVRLCSTPIILLVLLSLLYGFYSTYLRHSESPLRQAFGEASGTLVKGLGYERKEGVKGNSYGIFQTEIVPDIKNWKRLRPKTILFWTIPFDDPTMLTEFIFSESIPKSLQEFHIHSPQCGNCLLTYERRKQSYSQAVVFHAFYPNETDLEIPKKSNEEQLFVWWSQESASRSPFFSQLRDHFDLTMTPSRKSNIFSPYGSFPWVLKLLHLRRRNRDILKSLAKLKDVYLTSKFELDYILSTTGRGKKKKPEMSFHGDGIISQLLNNKMRMAIWISSNCRTTIGLLRERFVYEMLDAGMKIDMYGECSGRKFPIDSRWDPAFYEVISRYKFYLSFENSIHCHDYITEKLWLNGLYSGAVPVILGPSKSDVQAVLPPKSYIHVEDFESVDKLVNHLRLLHKNDNEYAKYLQWRTWTKYLNEDGVFLPENLAQVPAEESPNYEEQKLLRKYAIQRPIGVCNLCRKLHLPDEIFRKFTTDDADDRPECLDEDEAERTIEKLFRLY